MNKLILLLFVSTLLIFFIILFSDRLKSEKENILIIGGKRLQVELAQTPKQWTKGLGGRNSLANDQGMLFLFGKKGFYRFWMKNMRFPLDLIWIDQNTIVDLTQNVSEIDQEKIYQPKFPVDKVLEVNAGFVKENGIEDGDLINFMSY